MLRVEIVEVAEAMSQQSQPSTCSTKNLNNIQKPRQVLHLPGFLFFNSLTASGVQTGTNNNAVGNNAYKHGAKVEIF